MRVGKILDQVQIGRLLLDEWEIWTVVDRSPSPACLGDKRIVREADRCTVSLGIPRGNPECAERCFILFEAAIADEI